MKKRRKGQGPSHRSVRVGAEIRSALMELILRGAVRDPAAAGAVISEVRVTEDLSLARVYIRCLDPEGTEGGADAAKTLHALERARGFLRREVGKRLRTRQTPELDFRWDDSVDRGLRIEKLLDEVREQEES